MSGKARRQVAQLHWAGTTLRLGPWKAADIVPVWFGSVKDTAPNGWRVRVGVAWEGEGGVLADRAMDRAEFVAFGQLASAGIKAADFRRPDGTWRSLSE